MTTTPGNLKAEALSVLADIPHIFIALANAENSSAQRDLFISGLRDVHREVATAFAEPRPRNIGVTAITDDLTRWVALWTWHPHASRWVAQLRHLAHVADNAPVSGEFRWVGKSDAVCPRCKSLGHLEYQETTWDHRCPVAGVTWTWTDYRDAVRALLAEFAA